MSKSSNFLFIRSNSSGQIFVIIYVDDLVIGGEHLVDINKVKMLLSKKFEMKDMSELGEIVQSNHNKRTVLKYESKIC